MYMYTGMIFIPKSRSLFLDETASALRWTDMIFNLKSRSLLLPKRASALWIHRSAFCLSSPPPTRSAHALLSHGFQHASMPSLRLFLHGRRRRELHLRDAAHKPFLTFPTLHDSMLFFFQYNIYIYIILHRHDAH